ncbi:MAG: hypothetical protein ACAI25_00540, partial [Planctomycetota bacterium]
MKTSLRPRHSLARRFVDWYISKIGIASKPIAKMKLLFVLVTSSFFAHFFVVYGEYVFGEPARIKLDELKPEPKTKVSLTKRSFTKEDIEQLKLAMRAKELIEKAQKKLEEQEKKDQAELKKIDDELKELEKKKPEEKKPEPEKKPEEKKPEQKLQNDSIAEKAKSDAEVKRKVLLDEQEKKQTPVKNAPPKGGDTKNDVGVTKAPPEQDKALQGVEKNPDKVDKKPDPKLAAKNPDELKAPEAKKDPNFQAKVKEPPKAPEVKKDLAMASPDGNKDAKDNKVPDPDKLAFKVKNQGNNEKPLEGQKGIKPPKDAKPEIKPEKQ